MASMDDIKEVLDSIDSNIASQGAILRSMLTSQERQAQLLRADRTASGSQSISPIRSGGAGAGGGAGGAGGLLAGLGLGAAARGLGGAALGIGALGLAMPAFFGGLMAGDAALGWLSEFGTGFDFDNLKAAAIGFTDIIMEMDKDALVVLGALMGVSIVGGTRAAKGLGAMGFGISAFLGGLLAGDLVFTGVEALGGNLNFSGMKAAMVGFSDMIMSIDPQALTVLGGIMGLSAVTGLVGKRPTAIATALGAMGFGISAFMGGLLAGDMLFKGVEALGGTLDFNGLKSTLAGFSSSIEALTPTAASALGAIIAGSGVVAAFSRGTGIAAATKTAAVLTGVGAGISGLMLGLTTGAAGIDWINQAAGVDGSGLASSFSAFSNAIGELSPEASVALASILGISGIAAAFSRGTGISGAIATAAITTGIGAGISGLMLGLTAGGAGIEWINKVSGASGEGMVSAFKMFNDSIGELSNENSIKALGAILAVGTGLGALSGATGIGSLFVAGGIGLVMAGIGAGISGLMIGLTAGDVALSWLSKISGGGGGLASAFKLFNDSILSITPEGMTRLQELSSLNLGSGLSDLVSGITGFFALDVREGLGSRIRNFFRSLFGGGETQRESIITKLLREFEPLSGTRGQRVAEGVESFSSALLPLTTALSNLSQLNEGTLNFERMAKNLKDAVPTIEKAVMGDDGGWFGTEIKGLASPDVDYQTAVKNIVMLRQALAGVISEGTIEGMATVNSAGSSVGTNKSTPVIINAPNNSQTNINSSGGTASTIVNSFGGSSGGLDAISRPGGVH